MKYQMNQDDLNGFIEFIGIETKTKGKEIVFRYCPRCAGSAPKDDEWKFAINKNTGAFGCLRGSCGYHGHFVELCRDFGYKLGMDAEREYKNFPQPPHKILPRESALAYLADRGISKETAERFEVTAFENKPNILWMPFYNEYGKLVFIKYRNMAFKKGMKGSKEWCEPDGQPILFGMKQCTDFTRLVITEGQLDSMSVSEAGIANACSVPMGMNAFTWLPICYDWVKKFETVVVFGDLEKGHMSLLDTLKQRLPNRILAVRTEDYLGEKDANDILRNFGVDAVRKAVENAQEPDIGYVKELADVEDVDLNLLPKVKTGIYDIDSALGGGICYGQVCLLTGKRGKGKSTFMSNIVANALEQGVGVFAYSGELAGYHFKRWLNCQLAGEDNMAESRDEYGEIIYTLDPSVSKTISEWYRGKAFVYDNGFVDDGAEHETLAEVVREVASRRNVKLICIDNLMTAMDTVTEQNNLYLSQSNFVGELKRIAVRYDVAIILVAHPRKQGKGDDSAFDNDDVSGSADITNKVDIVMSYDRAAESCTDHNSELVISKNRLAGTLRMGKDKILLNYSAKSKRVTGTRELNRHYGWEKGTAQVVDIDVPF
ncbi:MAG: AAA family ATPase [Treponema sp.]|nr:AAA family ATPase [Treponema sp.]